VPDHPRAVATLPLEGASALIVSPDGRTLAAARGADTELWDITGPPRRLAALPARGGQVAGLAFSTAGVLAVAALDRVTELWNLADPAAPQRLGTAHGHDAGVASVAFSHDGTLMVTGGIDGTTQLWDVRHPDAPQQLGRPQIGRTEVVRTVAFSADGAAFGPIGPPAWEGHRCTLNTTPPPPARATGRPPSPRPARRHARCRSAEPTTSRLPTGSSRLPAFRS
jgi:WD40 repeat protein